MVFQGVSSDNSNAQNMNQINDLARDVQSKERVQIFKDDAGTRRVLLGKGLNDFFGLKVSPEGVDVYDATDSQLIFNSDQNIFKIVSSGTTSLSQPANTASVTVVVPHGQSAPPAVTAYLQDSTDYFPLPLSFINSGATTLDLLQYISFYVDSTNITFYCTSPLTFGAHTYSIKYYILQETAN